MNRLTKLIHAACLFHPVPICQKHLQIPGQTGRLTGNVDQFVHPILNDLGQSFGMDSISWRVQDNEVRFFFHLVQNLQHVPCNKSAVCDPVESSIFFCGFHRFFHDFHSDNFFCHFCQYLRDGAGSAVQVKDCHVSGVANIFPCCIVKDLGGIRVGLEERKRCNLKLQSQDFLVEIVLSVKKSGFVASHRIRKGIIDYMKDSHDLTFQGQIQQSSGQL